jgi:hypothetical protein
MEIKYYLTNEINGPLYIVYKSTVIKYTLASGATHWINTSPSSSFSEATIDTFPRGHMIKISPIGIILNHITLSYETIINKKTNFELEIGYINSSLSNNDFISKFFNGIFFDRVLNNTGFYFKPGFKFFSYRSGKSYSKPFNGGYSKLEFAYSNITVQNFNTIATATGSVSTNLRSQAIGGFFTSGIQAPLSKKVYLDFSVGIGFTKQISNYSNPDYVEALNQSKNSSYARQERLISNYYGFLRMPYSFGVSFNYSLKVGYVLFTKPRNKGKKSFKSKNIKGVHYYN